MEEPARKPELEAQRTLGMGCGVASCMRNSSTGEAIRNPMAELLQVHLCREYWGKGENLTPEHSAVTHLTLFARWPYDTVQRLARSTTIHVYGIAADSFMLELRNLPMSVTLEKAIRDADGKIDNGQKHTTARLKLRPSDGPLVRELAELVRRVPSEGRIDMFPGSRSMPVRWALLRLAEVLETFDSKAIERTAQRTVCQREWDSMAE